NRRHSFVMAGLGPGIPPFARQVESMWGLLAREDAKAWMAGPSPAMTAVAVVGFGLGKILENSP
ncbi:MAG: hypothetical protein ACJ8CO_05950, partial [Microvirga sp.]